MKDPVLKRKIVFLAAVASLSASLQVFVDHFIYWDVSLPQEFWRLWTGHWVHVGWVHYFLNILAFVCLPFIFPRVRIWQFAALLFILPPLISLSFYCLLPDIEAYAGLSGVLHGAYVAIAIVQLRDLKERGFAGLVLGLILAKLIWENTVGGSSAAELIGSPVLVEAHLLGVIWGAILAALYLTIGYITRR